MIELLALAGVRGDHLRVRSRLPVRRRLSLLHDRHPPRGNAAVVLPFARRRVNALLIDERGLDVLDFQRIRERYAGQTHAPRSYARAIACEPDADFAAVRRLVGETTEMRALIAEAGFSVQRIDDVDEAVATAARGVPLGARELRAIADALAASAAAVKAVREAELELPLLRERSTAFRALPAIVHRIVDAIDERGVVLDRASAALARIRRGMAQAQDDARDRAAAIVRSSRYAQAIQDAIVTLRDGRYVVPVKAEFQGQIPGIVHDSSSSGQTLFVEPLETLEANNRLRALQSQEQAEIARILGELSSLVARRGGAGRDRCRRVRRAGPRGRARGRRAPHASRRAGAGRGRRRRPARGAPSAARRARRPAVDSHRRRDADR